jgi:hypothetical protein
LGPPVGPRSQCNYPILSYKRTGQAMDSDKLTPYNTQQYNTTLSVDVGYYAPAARTM